MPTWLIVLIVIAAIVALLAIGQYTLRRDTRPLSKKEIEHHEG